MSLAAHEARMPRAALFTAVAGGNNLEALKHANSILMGIAEDHGAKGQRVAFLATREHAFASGLPHAGAEQGEKAAVQIRTAAMQAAANTGIV